MDVGLLTKIPMWCIFLIYCTFVDVLLLRTFINKVYFVQDNKNAHLQDA